MNVKEFPRAPIYLIIVSKNSQIYFMFDWQWILSRLSFINNSLTQWFFDFIKKFVDVRKMIFSARLLFR